jgi:hypothetical protein
MWITGLTFGDVELRRQSNALDDAAAAQLEGSRGTAKARKSKPMGP